MRPTARITVPLVAVAALADCAHSPSTVAIVGDKVISGTEITEAVNSCRKINPQIKRLDMLFPLILGEIADEVPPKLGRIIDATKLRATMEADPDASQTSETPCRKAVEGRLRMRHLQTPVDVGAVLQELPRVEIDPCYGARGPRRIDRRGGSISIETKG